MGMGCSIAVQHGARPVPSFIGILPCGLPSEDCAQCLPYYLDLPILLHMECPAMMLAQRCDARGSAQRYAMPSLFPWPPAASTPFHQIHTATPNDNCLSISNLFMVLRWGALVQSSWFRGPACR